MPESISYIFDEHGDKVSIVVPLKEWKKIHKHNAMLRKKIKILTGIQNGIQEIADAKKSGNPIPTLSEFIHENNS